MNVYLIKTPEYDTADYLRVIELLQSFPGEIRFFSEPDMSQEKSDEQKPTTRLNDADINTTANKLFEKQISADLNDGPLSWATLFNICNSYRERKNLSNEDFVVLITKRKNSLNWFAAMDTDSKRNIFVQASDWEYFIQSPGKYPVAYEIAAYILRNLMKLDVANYQDFTHTEPQGCMNDFCENKSQIILKLRTGDICSHCQQRLIESKVPLSVIRQVLSIFEGIRKQMLFSQSIHERFTLSRIEISGNFDLLLTDYNNTKIKLTPTQKSIYFLFLIHTDGIRFADIPDRKDELSYIYKALTKISDELKIKKTIDNICDDALNNFTNLRTYISQIKSIFQKIAKANPDFKADNYIIGGEDGKNKKIALDRKLIHVHPSVTFLPFKK